jgi:hypothetical protein
MMDCKSMPTSMVMNLKKMNKASSDSGEIDPHLCRSLMYPVNTRPDICYAMNVAKHVLRYLRGTIDYGLRYASGVDMRFQGYSDADWVGSTVDRKNTFDCCFTL